MKSIVIDMNTISKKPYSQPEIEAYDLTVAAAFLSGENETFGQGTGIGEDEDD